MAMEERYIAAVDLGSSKIALTVSKITGEDVQVLFYKEVPSTGIRNSSIFIHKQVLDPLTSLIREAESELGVKILQAVVGLPKCDIVQETRQASARRTNPDNNITREEIDMLKSLAQEEYPLPDSDRDELYGAVAQSFSTDDDFQIVEEDIIGMISEKIEGNFRLFIGRKSPVKNIDKVFNSLGIAVAKKYFIPGTLSKAILTEDEMDSGVALIDLGAGSTSVTIYKNKILRYYNSIPFGGRAITNDIRTECTISEALAENIKRGFGACMPDRLSSMSDKIIQIESETAYERKQIPVKYLSEIITARAKEIIDAILYFIDRSGYADSLRSGVVITGGGANLVNIGNYIKLLSGYTVRTGYPRHLFSAGGCEQATTVSAVASIGMILSAKVDAIPSCITAVEEFEEGFSVEIEEEEKKVEDEPRRETAEEKADEVVKEEKRETGEKKEDKKADKDKPGKESVKRPKVFQNFFKGGLNWIGELYKNSEREDKDDASRY